MTGRTFALRGAAWALAAFPSMLAAAPPAAPAGAPAAPAAAAGERQSTFISPMGEPFRGVTPDLLWFRQADKNGDGKVTVLEMRADAYRFFKTLDLNHDGEIDPDELRHYEEVVAPEINVSDLGGRSDLPDSIATSDSGPNDAFGDLPPVTIEHHRVRPRATRGAGRLAYFDLPEPVAAADSDMNRGVSIREFDQAAQKRFLLLDTGHDGYLSYAKLQELRH